MIHLSEEKLKELMADGDQHTGLKITFLQNYVNAHIHDQK